MRSLVLLSELTIFLKGTWSFLIRSRQSFWTCKEVKGCWRYRARSREIVTCTFWFVQAPSGYLPAVLMSRRTADPGENACVTHSPSWNGLNTFCYACETAAWGAALSRHWTIRVFMITQEGREPLLQRGSHTQANLWDMVAFSQSNRARPFTLSNSRNAWKLEKGGKR